jgi:hypothetical protein
MKKIGGGKTFSRNRGKILLAHLTLDFSDLQASIISKKFSGGYTPGSPSIKSKRVMGGKNETCEREKEK